MKLSLKVLQAATLVLLILSTSCKDDKDPVVQECNLETSTAEFEEASMNVTYTIETTGDAEVSKFTYYDETGKMEIEKPDLPYEKEILLTTQKTIQAKALGKVTNGSIKISFKGVGLNSSYEGSDECSHTSN
ncbi:MAG: hypothetical protein PHX54_13345 [Lentimicrobiaceae bacterium]|nr:hypothetical protein [Lentimicrobiaceae bacterium]